MVMRTFAGLVIVSSLVILGSAGAHAQGRQLGGDAARADRISAASTLSDHRHFKVSIAALASSPVLNAMHAWKFQIRTPSGRPVEDATVSIGGGNPDRGHKLPTAPRVTRYLGDGKYLVEGMKFHMAGDWRLTLAIVAGRRRDTVSFDIVVR